MAEPHADHDRRPLRIAQVVAGVAVGGLQKHVSDLCAGLVGAGHEVSVVCHPSLDLSLLPAVRRFEADLDRGRRSPRALLALGRRLREIGPDVVHAHASKAAGMALTARRLRLAPSAPVVATLHSVKKRMAVYERADRVIAVSPGAAARVRRAPVDVVYNGVALPASIEPGPGAPERRGATALAIGRLVEVKGFDVLIDAWDGVDADLWIVGDGPERAALERRIERRGLADRVRLLGTRDDVAWLMTRADLVVVSSRREGFSYVMGEALLLRRPVVATRVPGPIDLMPERTLAPVGDAEALRDAVRRALDDPEGTARALEPAWSTAASELTLERMVERTVAAYRAAMRPSR